MRKKKVVYIDQQSYHNLEKYDRGVLSNISGFDITFVSSALIGDSSVARNVNVKKLFNYNNTKHPLIKLLSYSVGLIKTLFTIFKQRPDIVHLQWFKFIIFDIAFLFMARFLVPRSKFVFTMHNVFPHDTKPALRKLYLFAASLFHKIIVHDLYTAERIKKFGIPEYKIRVIKHGLIPFEDTGDVESDFTGLNFDNRMTFSSIGILSRYKGTDLLIKAWVDSGLSERKDCQLLLCGRVSKNASESVNEAKSLNNVVVIDRFLSERELLELTHNSDMLVLPYREISQSGVLLSVLNQRIPLIVSNKGGLTEPFSISEIGYVLSKVTVSAITDALQIALQHRSKIAELRADESVWKPILASYSWAEISSKTNELYEQELDRGECKG